jgi:nucleoside-diphosphate-sugar epimerase
VLPVLGGGGQELSLVYGPDLAEAVVAAATSPRTRGGTYHAAHPDVVTQREWMSAIAGALGVRARVVSIPSGAVRGALRVTAGLARARGRSTLLDPSKAEELLAPAWTCTSAALLRDAGWRARHPLSVAFAETARWYREAGWL